MKRYALIVLLMIGMLAAASADVQFRMAGSYTTPFSAIPGPTVHEWTMVAMPAADSLSGWHWEIIFSHFGFGMHYGVAFNEPATVNPDIAEWTVDWKGDFFLSYHLADDRWPIDPFVEVGWGNAGRAAMSDHDEYYYPDWEEELESGNALSLALFRYAAAGIGLELGSFVAGGKVSYLPTELVMPVPGTEIAMREISPFEFSFYAGVALGGR